jgi:hypothetical protein
MQLQIELLRRNAERSSPSPSAPTRAAASENSKPSFALSISQEMLYDVSVKIPSIFL